MVDKNSAPSYSIGGNKKTSFINYNNLPGPGAYESISYFKPDNADNKMPKGKRFNQYHTIVPGPGTYTHKPPAQHIPTALVKSRTKQTKIDKLPGPGAYEPDFHKVIKSNSGYKIGISQKLFDYAKSTQFIPGPGQYNTDKSSLLGLNQAVNFGPERKIQLAIDPKTPGPGQYQLNAHFDGSSIHQPNVVFSKSSRSYSTNSLIPGPGSYTIKSQMDQSIQKSKGFKIAWRHPNYEQIALKANSLPGPGTYQSHSPNLVKKSTPSFSVGKEQKLKIQNIKEILLKPGPMKYQSKISAFQNRSAIIGKDKRKGLGIQSRVPGPGAYEAKTLLNNQTYSLPKSQRKSLADQKKTPGPQQYNPNLIVNNQYQNIGIGIDKRRTFQIKQKFPGPGEYNFQDKKNNGGYNFGKQKRDHQKESKTPGPGHYELPSTVSNLPRYASTQKR